MAWYSKAVTMHRACVAFVTMVLPLKVKGKVFYGQEPPSGESTTTECGFNYQLRAVITEVAQWGAPSCSQPQAATNNGVRDGRSNWLVAPPPYTGQYPLSSTYFTLQCGLQITRLAALSQPRTCDFRMPDQRSAGAATQGFIICINNNTHWLLFKPRSLEKFTSL